MESVYRYVDQKFDAVKAAVIQLVDERVRIFTDALYASAREGAQTIADRIRKIKDAKDMACDADLTDSVEYVSLPKHIADMLDALRVKKPAVFAALFKASQALVEADPVTRSVTVAKLADALLAGSG